MTDIFILAAGATDTGALVDAFIALPLEDCERSEANPALLPVIFLEHAHVRIFSVALIASHWEV